MRPRFAFPLLLAYGEKDRRVPLIHGEAFRKALQAAPGRAPDSLEWQVYADEGHGLACARP